MPLKKLSVSIFIILLAAMALAQGVAADPAPVVTPLPAVETSGHLGVVEASTAPDLARRAGVGWQRANFFWNRLQPASDSKWEWSGAPISDAQLDEAVAAGITVVGLLGNPPAWATRDGSVPRNLTLPAEDPNNYWSHFVSGLAKRYAGRINYWIVWNEPDIDPGQLGSTWSGTEDEYYYLLKTASLAAKAANPAAKIVFAGTTYFADFNQGRKLFLERILTVASYRDPTAAANGYYFDVVDLHVYSSVYEMANIPQKNREALRRFGLDKPLWISESNVVPWNDPTAPLSRDHFRASLDEQASFVIEGIAMAMSAGVDRISVYKMRDGLIERGEPFGLMRNDGSVRPAYVAFQVAAKYLDRDARAEHEQDGDIHYVYFDRPDSRVVVVWNGSPSPRTAKIVPVGSRAVLVDKYGNVTPADPRQNAYSIPLPPATANTVDGQPDSYLIGGDPRILVEEDLNGSLNAPGNSIYFPATGFHVEGNFLDYYRKRGGLRSFGLPISRRFILLGTEVQFFQRQVTQVRQDGSVGTLNILDADLMPYTAINNATLPSISKHLQDAAARPGSADYGSKALQFVAMNVPNVWEGQRVNFLQSYTNTVKPEDAYPDGKAQLNLLPGINLELWGLPTSPPQRDPNNGNFVFQRFQRGVLHYDRASGATQGVLLASYLAAIITGRNLPADLGTQAKGSRFSLQYDNTQPKGLSRPAQLPSTNMKDAFEREDFARIPPLLRP